MAYKMAIIGYGGMAGWHNQSIKKDVPEFEVVGAYDIRDEAKEKIKEKGLRLYQSPEEIYNDKEIDLVLVATPNDSHKPYVISALQAGKNVICEKPVTLSASMLEEMMQAAKDAGKLFTVHQNRRWDRDYLIVKKILKDGILNKPYIIESRVQGSRQALHGWRGYKVNGGGMVYDWGIHLLDQMLDLIPEKVVSVSAHLHNVFAPEVDDNFITTIRFENGLTYLVNIAMNCFILQPRWHISCEDGTAVIANWECEGKIVKLADESELGWGEEIVYTAAGPTRSMAPRPKQTTVELELPKPDSGEWNMLYKNIAGTLDGKEELIVKPEQALRVMKVIDAIFEADRTGAMVKCNI